MNIVIRPHPTERHDVYQDIAARSSRVHVTNDGNVVPWILATKAVLHNGCTTGVEAFVMGVPAISYREAVNEEYDHGFYRLPNAVSHQCFNFEQLREMIHQILSEKVGVADGDERHELIGRYLASRNGPLACEKMVDVLAAAKSDQDNDDITSPWMRLQRRLIADGYHLYKRFKPMLPGSHNRPEFQKHRYPGISLDGMNRKIERLQEILKDTTRIKVEQLSDVLFKISV
jgi:hypothetical protein